MKEESNLKEIISGFPDEPGVYIMLDNSGNIIYIGKANSLRKRVSSYFSNKDKDPKTSVLVKNISSIEYIVTESEIEALILESNLIKKHKPKFNIRLKDDKRYPYIKVTINEDYPRVLYTRTIDKTTEKVFGPFTDARAAKNTANMINNIFKLKRCNREIPLKKGERPCLNYQIKKCCGVCQNKISRDEYRSLVDNAIEFLEGNTEPVVERLNKKMSDYSKNFEYEKAAAIRDIIFDIQKTSMTQKVDIQKISNVDFISCGIFGSEAIVIVFEFRRGILNGRKLSLFDNAQYSTDEDIIQSFIVEYYKEKDIPETIVIENKISDQKLIEQHLCEISQKKIIIGHPKSSEDHSIMRMIRKNIDILAAERNSSLEPITALEELAEILGLESIPEVIVCFDISNIQGKFPVASMVQFRLGLPDKKSYRRFKIRGYEGANDPGMIHEALSRRIQHLVNENLPFPDLIVIDGGPTQLSRAIEAAENFNLDLKIISIAKKFEEIYTHPQKAPLRLKENSNALKLIQQIRDESHRFAITYHRKLRDTDLTSSKLDNIPDLSHKNKMALLQKFKSIENIATAEISELMTIDGLGERKAKKIKDFFQNNNS
ncbi:MAG TPA: excinuclease ABC subunit UvrC [Spirochaetota bacterium]|nr:excinuclease ABC subunit UvrC [Spirochaetota bacterium]